MPPMPSVRLFALGQLQHVLFVVITSLERQLVDLCGEFEWQLAREVHRRADITVMVTAALLPRSSPCPF